jgi:hypothetical protein
MRGITLLYVKVIVPSRQDRDQIVSFRIIQLDTLDHYDERKNPIVFQGQRSKIKVVALLNRKTL